MIEIAVKEVPDQVVQLLNRVEFDRQKFVWHNAISGKSHQSVLANELPQVLLGENQRVNDVAGGDRLLKPGSSPIFIFFPDVVFVRIADSLAQILEEHSASLTQEALHDVLTNE
jgi:hypothetical protein